MLISQYLGPASVTDGTDTDELERLYYILRIDGASLQDPEMGRLTNINLADEESDKLIIAILNVLYEKTKDYTADPTYKIVGNGLYQGRESIGIENPVLMDTFSLTFQIRIPSSAGPMPDPDDL